MDSALQTSQLAHRLQGDELFAQANRGADLRQLDEDRVEPLFDPKAIVNRDPALPLTTRNP